MKCTHKDCVFQAVWPNGLCERHTKDAIAEQDKPHWDNSVGEVSKPVIFDPDILDPEPDECMVGGHPDGCRCHIKTRRGVVPVLACAWCDKTGRQLLQWTAQGLDGFYHGAVVCRECYEKAVEGAGK